MRNRRGRIVLALVVMLSVTACGAGTTDVMSDGGGETMVSPTASPVDPMTVRDLVTTIADAGLAVPNPRDVTQHDCPTIGCTNKIDTDTVSIMSFPSSGSAQLYAGTTQHVFQAGRIVLIFPESVSTDERRAYQRIVKQAIE